MSHTPGPWTVDYEMDGCEGYSIAIPEIERMLHDVEWADPDEWSRDLANAFLISTAPDGLALAKMVMAADKKAGDCCWPSSNDWMEIVILSRFLIAKSETK